MSQEQTSITNEKGMSRLLVGLLAAMPLLLLLGLYLSDISGWDEWLSYGGFFVVLIILVLGFAAGSVTEWFLRRRYSSLIHRLPWLCVAGLICVFALPVAFLLARPVAEQVPRWSRVYQSIWWDTSKPHPTHASNQGFALVFVARGNKAEHQFESGYLNWSGEESAGFSDIDLTEQTFAYWSDGKRVTLEANEQALRDRVGQSGIKPIEADRISDEIWQAMQLAQANKPITVQHGQVDAIGQTAFDYEDIKLGGGVWMAVVALSFAAIAQFTLPRPGDPTHSARQD